MDQEQVNNRKASIRRLGSFANLTFNPFNRRKSGHIPDATAVVSSNNATSVPPLPPATPQTSSDEFALPVRRDFDFTRSAHQTAVLRDRRRSYIPLADENRHALPKSRTMSNLPLPTKMKAPATAPKPRSTVALPLTRIPTPPRLDSKARLMPTPKSILKTGKVMGLQRSDTEPLLGLHDPTGTQAFKENMALNPVMKLPEMQADEDTHMYPIAHLTPGQSTWYNDQLPFARATPVTAFRPSRILRRPVAHSSPITNPAYRRPSTPGHLTCRPSQSVLGSISNNVGCKKSSYGEDIKQHQLLTPRHAPTPAPPATPMKSAEAHAAAEKASNTPLSIYNGNEPDMGSEDSILSTLGTDPDEITESKSIEYWCGRLSVLTDRHRNDHFARCLEQGEPARLEDEEETHDRIRQAMQYLYSVCASEEAKASFKAFHHRLDVVSYVRLGHGDEDILAPHISWTQIVSLAGHDSGGRRPRRLRSGICADFAGSSDAFGLTSPGTGSTTVGSSRKMTFMSRLLGKNKAAKQAPL